MSIRHLKVILPLLSAVFLLVVFFNNLTDYNSNYQFVQHVLSMDQSFKDNKLMYRSITNPTIHMIFYDGIIAWEGLCCFLIGLGSFRLWQARTAPLPVWKAAKYLVSLGLVCGLIQWYFAFMTVGGEWFLMWQSKTWNGQDAAFRLFCFMGITLLFVNQADE